MNKKCPVIRTNGKKLDCEKENCVWWQKQMEMCMLKSMGQKCVIKKE